MSSSGQDEFEVLNPYEGGFGGPWFKGDLHIHTTASDGRQDRSVALRRLREEGFDFAALADHDVYAPGDDAERPVLLGNCEFNTEEGDVLGLFAEAERAEGAGVQQMLDAVRAAGGMPVLPHPKIGEFRQEKADRAITCAKLLRGLTGYAGMEVYTHNLGSGFQLAVDRLDAVWTCRCKAGPSPVKIWGFACSDSHDPHTISADVGILAAAASCDGASLRAAIEAGRFYALAGSPARFKDISVDEGVLRVTAEGAEMVQVYGAPQSPFAGERRRLAIAWADGKPTVELAYRIRGCEGFLRAEAMDRQGNLVVANPIEIRPAG